MPLVFTAAEIRARAVPGVRCGQCLGRIDDSATEMKRKLHDKLRPGQSFVPPVLCSDCWFGALLDLASEVSEEDNE
jgi:hypothetical protein